MFKRTGRFRIARKLIDERPDWVFEVLSFLRFVPTSVEYDSGTENYIYSGKSPKFDQIPISEFDAKYDINIDTTDAGQIYKIQVKRVIQYDS